MKIRFFGNFSTFIILAVLSLGLAACKTTNKTKPEATDGVTAGGISSEGAASTDSGENAVVSFDNNECPAIEVLDGTGVLTAYAGDGPEKPQNVDHQATLLKSQRECRIEDGAFTLSVGAAGRAAKGPKSVSDAVTLPIRIAVIHGQGEVLFSQLYNHLVPLQIDQPVVFSIKEKNIRLPLDKKDNLKILVGFDTIGSSQAAAATDEATPASDQAASAVD